MTKRARHERETTAPALTPDLRIDYVPLGDLIRWPRNPREHDLGAIHASVQRFGFVSPIIVDETSGRIVAGHGRLDLLQAMRRRGEPPPPRIRVRDDGEWLVPVIRGITFASELEAEAYLVADNQMTLLGTWNDADLVAMLERQAAAHTLLGTGFDGDDLDALLEELGRQGDTAPPERFVLYSQETIARHGFDFYRATGFPYRRLPLHRQMQDVNKLAATTGDALLNTLLGYQVADTYHPHRFECHAVGMKSPLESFADDAQLARAIRLQLDAGTLDTGLFPMLGLVSGTQACANFRPGVACHYYRRYGSPGGLVLDPCTGYGGRLVGWIASRLGGHYLGVDPSSQTHAGNTRLAAALAPPESVTLVQSPFEDLDLTPYAERVDFVLTSPPYFVKEVYADEPTQSRLRYPTLDALVQGFLEPLFRSCFVALKPGHHCVINIADIKVKARLLPLVELSIEAGRAAGFVFEGTQQLRLGHHYGEGDIEDLTKDGTGESKAEPLLVFRK